MRKLSLALLLLIVSLSSFSQKKDKIKGNRDVTTVTKGFDREFTAIEISDNLKVTIKNSLQNSYTLTADKNLHNVIQFTTNEGVLKIYTTNNIVSSKKQDITLNLSSIELILLKDESELKSEKVFECNTININARGSSRFDVEIKSKQATIAMLNDAKGKIKLQADQIAITIADKSNLDADINTDKTNASLSNSTKLKLDGNSDKVSFTSTDSSELDAKRLKVSSANLSTKDKSELHIDAHRNLSIDARDKSKVFVYSEPKIDIEKFTDRAEIIKR